jgi:hypothetical protein
MYGFCIAYILWSGLPTSMEVLMTWNIKKSLLAAAIGALSLGGLTACAYDEEAPAPSTVYVATAPPPPVYEEPGPPPAVGFVWINGYYDYDGGHYVWRHGYWDHGRPGQVYVHDQWEHGPHGYYHERGHWH